MIPQHSGANHEDEERLARDLVEAGSEVAGAAVGGALGLIGGPGGVAAGAAGGVLATHTLKRVGAQLRRRWLDPREEVRIGGAFAIAADEIRTRIEAGQALRADGFFEPRTEGNRSPAEEVLEGVLKAASEAYEGRKVPYIAKLYASIAFREDISPAYASGLIRSATRCTWRQLVVLALLDRDPPNFARRMERVIEPAVAHPKEPGAAIWADFDALGYEGLIGVRQEDGSVAHVAAVLGGGSFASIGWPKATPTATGESLIELMGLRDIPLDDLAEVSAALKR